MNLQLQLKDYRLTTAEILYRYPDHPRLLQTLIWQFLDLPPDLPRLVAFLRHWENHIDGPLVEVRVAHIGIIDPGKWRNASHLTIH